MDGGQQLFYQGQSGESVNRGWTVSIDPQSQSAGGVCNGAGGMISEEGVYWDGGRGHEILSSKQSYCSLFTLVDFSRMFNLKLIALLNCETINYYVFQKGNTNCFNFI